jgi:hypothetical protein
VIFYKIFNSISFLVFRFYRTAHCFIQIFIFTTVMISYFSQCFSPFLHLFLFLTKNVSSFLHSISHKTNTCSSLHKIFFSCLCYHMILYSSFSSFTYLHFSILTLQCFLWDHHSFAYLPNILSSSDVFILSLTSIKCRFFKSVFIFSFLSHFIHLPFFFMLVPHSLFLSNFAISIVLRLVPSFQLY